MNGWINQKVVIERSAIEGRGLFAVADIARGEQITRTGNHDSVIMTDEEFSQYIKTVDTWDAISVGGHLNKVFRGSRDDNPTHFCNHSCEPNADLNSWGLVAIRTIRAGAEVTSDYRPLSSTEWVLNCHCRARSCTGVVRGLVL